ETEDANPFTQLYVRRDLLIRWRTLAHASSPELQIRQRKRLGVPIPIAPIDAVFGGAVDLGNARSFQTVGLRNARFRNAVRDAAGNRQAIRLVIAVLQFVAQRFELIQTNRAALVLQRERRRLENAHHVRSLRATRERRLAFANALQEMLALN